MMSPLSFSSLTMNPASSPSLPCTCGVRVTRSSKPAAGAEALSVLESRSDVAVVVIDCDMRGMSGPETNKIILARWPHIRIIAMSGRPPAAVLPDEVDFIHKPFKGADLVARVRNVLNH